MLPIAAPIVAGFALFPLLSPSASPRGLCWTAALAIIAAGCGVFVQNKNVAPLLFDVSGILAIRGLLVVVNKTIRKVPPKTPEEEEEGKDTPNKKKPTTKVSSNEQIRQKLLQAFWEAEEEIDIISPWLSWYAIDGEMQSRIREALSRGVVIQILYGYNDSGGNSSERSQQSDEVASELNKKFQTFGNNFRIRKDTTHEKLLLCDNKYFPIGSYNLLSFGGDFDSSTRREIMYYSEDQEDILKYREKYFYF